MENDHDAVLIIAMEQLIIEINEDMIIEINEHDSDLQSVIVLKGLNDSCKILNETNYRCVSECYVGQEKEFNTKEEVSQGGVTNVNSCKTEAGKNQVA